MNRRDFIQALGFATFASAAFAEDEYPRRAIKLIVPYTPGTGIDILARSLSAKLGERMGAAVVVENRPGASGNIGTDAVAKSPPDGYTLLMTASTLVVNPGLFRHLPYDPVKDFAPIAPLALGSLALVTRSEEHTSELQSPMYLV